MFFNIIQGLGNISPKILMSCHVLNATSFSFNQAVLHPLTTLSTQYFIGNFSNIREGSNAGFLNYNGSSFMTVNIEKNNIQNINSSFYNLYFKVKGVNTFLTSTNKFLSEKISSHMHLSSTFVTLKKTNADFLGNALFFNAFLFNEHRNSTPMSFLTNAEMFFFLFTIKFKKTPTPY